MIKKIKYILYMILLFAILAYGDSYARITTNDPSVNSGETVTITINSQEPVASGAVNISSNSGLTFVKAEGGTVNGTLVAFAGTDNKTSNIAKYTFTAPTVNTDTTYKVVFASKDMSNKDGNSVSDSTATATVTVKAKQTTPTPTPDPEPEPTPEPEKPTEPTFTDTNKTMYSTGNINLRASWSTSSSATSIEEGTELTVTGTSKEKVNGYVWYRVSYNGQTKYVASSLLTSTKPEKEEETKSDNANLKSLVVENFNITPNFSSDVTEYTLEVTSEVTELKISAEPEDSNATVTVEGEKELKEGENTVVISVNAEDGTTKSYEIKVTKKEETVFGLTSLKIKDANIEFKPDIYNYSINIQSDVDILEIQATASEEDATVEIIGNEGLKEGENIITIMVSSKDGEKNATYQIKATKEEEKTSENVQSNIKIYIYAGIGIVALIALIIVIVYTVKHRKEDDLEGFEGFPEELPEKNYNNEINDDEEAQNIELEEKENDIDEQEEIDRKKYFLDTQSEDDFENIKKKRGKHF